MINKLWIFLVVFFLGACGNSVDTSLKTNDPDETFSLLLQECIDHSFGSVPGVSMTINSPLLQQKWGGAAGFADKESNKKSEASQPFRIASVTKTFVATAILRLHEMDSLSIDEPISKYIDASFISILEADGYEPQKILIKHCLNHTSGLADYAMGNDDGYIKAMVKNPQKRWTRKEQLEGAMAWGDKIGPPGKQTDYCDTGYILLGAIIEKYFNGNLAHGLRELLKFDSLGMHNTWLETLEEHPAADSPKVHRYHGRFETTDWDASIDLYGGGGLVSTTSDLADFMEALFHHKIYDDPATLDLMLSIPEYISPDEVNDRRELKYYNYGLWTVNVFGKKAHLHNGIWGTTMLYLPFYETSLSVNTTNGEAERLMKKVILVLKQLKANQ